MNINRALLSASWRSWYANDLRIVGPGWLQLVWTFIFSSAIGVSFFVLGMSMRAMSSGRWPSFAGGLHWLGMNLIVALTIGFTIHALFALFSRVIGADRIRAFDNPRKGLYFGGVPLLGTAIGWPIGAWFISSQVGNWFPFGRLDAIAGALLLSVLISVLFYFHFDAKARQIAAEKRATEAQLRLLQGQIEPHFLFNTLANVQSLIEHDPLQARQMLEAFTDYLRASLTGLRGDDGTVASELEIAESYLRLLGARMQERLQYRIDADATVRQLPLPPLLLQPLVENAIVHGLEPQVHGGSVQITARTEGAWLLLVVQDDGRGPAAAPRRAGRAGAGVALDNIRARLLGRYGSAASLTLEATEPGTRATLRLPLESKVCMP